LVLLDVVVMDKAGNPVPGLRLEDFSVTEDGKPQALSFLTAPKTDAPPPVPPLPEGVYSNAPLYRLSGSTPTVVVLDAANTAFNDQVYVRRQMLQYLRDQYQPGQRTAIFALTDKLFLLQDFTADPELLAASLKRFEPGEPGFSKMMAGGEPPVDALRFTSKQQYQQMVVTLDRFQRSQVEYTTNARAEVTLAALRRINRILAGLPGRKNVIWVTGGFPFTLDPAFSVSPSSDLSEMFRRPGRQSAINSNNGLGHDQRSLFADQIREISAQLATAQVAIYPVDAQGLVPSRSLGSSNQQETMREIALETGGKAFINRNDVENGFSIAQRDRAATYTVGYYPSNKKFDAKYRSIELKVDHPGLQTTYRHGYFADALFADSPAKLDRSLSEAWEDGVPDTQVIFEAKITAGANGKTRIEFLVDPNTLSFAEDVNGRKFDVGFYVASCSADGKILEVKGAKLDRAFPPEIFQQINREGMRLHIDVDEPTTSRDLRIAVRDNRTGYIGTLAAAYPSKK
jgi:VWFA-related protein